MGAGIVAPPLSLFSLGRNKGSGFAGHGLFFISVGGGCDLMLRCVSWKTRESRALHWTFLRVLWPNLFPLRRVRSLSFRRHGFLFGSRIWLSATGLMVLSPILSVNTVACFESGDGGERWHHVLWPSRLLVSMASVGSLRGICWHFQPT